MVEILTHAGCFIGIILLGWALRRVGFFKESDFHVILYEEQKRDD